MCVIGIVVILICVGLSGCEETYQVTGDTNQIKIIDVSVTTQWYIPGYGTYQTYTKSGFYKNYPAQAYNPRYIIKGTAKNIAGENLNEIIIKALFCDSNHNQLISETTTIQGLAVGNTKNFEIYLDSNNQYFQQVDNVDFNIDVSK